MIIREEGIYWVRIDSYLDIMWTTAYWVQWKNEDGVQEEGQWLSVLGWCDGCYSDTDFLDIGSKVNGGNDTPKIPVVT